MGVGLGRCAPFLECALTVTHVSAATWSMSAASSSASTDQPSPLRSADGGSRSSSTPTRLVLTAGSRVSTP